MSTSVFNVSGMHCSSCSMLISMNLKDLPGVEDVTCDHTSGRTVVTFDGTSVSTDSIVRTIEDAGYSAVQVG